MKRVLFFDLIHPNNGGIYNLSEIKSLALKQISRGRFEMVDEEIISKIEFQGEIIKVVFTNEVSVSDFIKELCIADNREPSLDFMYNEISSCSLTLVQMINDYKQKNYILGSNINDAIWFKLYSKFNIQSEIRKMYHAEWINYEKQLEEGNIIYDTKGLCGLWAMPKEMLLKCFNEQCLERYGSSLLILKPVADCYYLNDRKEIIGDRFEVIDKIDFNCIEDIGRLSFQLQQIDFKQYEKIKEELKNEKIELKKENRQLQDACVWQDSTISKLKITRWCWLLRGIILGAVLAGLIFILYMFICKSSSLIYF